MSVWSHPWIAAALSPEGVKVPPEAPTGVRWNTAIVQELNDQELTEWGAFVRTGWDAAALRTRLAGGAVIIRVWDSGGQLRGTCVVRPRDNYLWLLETLVARPRGAGWGGATMHAAVRAIWDRGGSSVGFVWELSAGGLLRAWWRGWMAAAVSVEWGWRWSSADSICGFCPNTTAWIPTKRPPVMPVVVSEGSLSIVVSDSGLMDGWAHILAVSGHGVNWERVAKIGEWRDLWFVGSKPPADGDWHWTGEAVVRGILNKGSIRLPMDSVSWITAEVSSS